MKGLTLKGSITPKNWIAFLSSVNSIGFVELNPSNEARFVGKVSPGTDGGGAKGRSRRAVTDGNLRSSSFQAEQGAKRRAQTLE
ncbi:hypothetical protein MPL3356_70096 [Mesorhizobium plurifarium]|uniref:Uncharacterized protein n=1 Tax=Mesorhizobium plurifarium TaxID=69974 RepID=A0A090EC01_MESPL|nr:hypothetical protein MPL3356_70096 [Mesorhizobium plurifarium]